MSKITSEEKIKAVESYIQGELGLGEVRKKYGVPKTTFCVHRPCGAGIPQAMVH